MKVVSLTALVDRQVLFLHSVNVSLWEYVSDGTTNCARLSGSRGFGKSGVTVARFAIKSGKPGGLQECPFPVCLITYTRKLVIVN